MAKASQVVLLENEFYIIKAPNGKVLEVKDFNTENGAAIQLWSYAGHPWQQWQFVDAGGGRWRIQNRFTGKVIDLALGGVVDLRCWRQPGMGSGAHRPGYRPDRTACRREAGPPAHSVPAQASERPGAQAEQRRKRQGKPESLTILNCRRVRSGNDSGKII